MGTLLIFLQVYDDAGDYDVLNKLICAWRDAEQQTRSQCGLDSVISEYPGCIRYSDNANDGFTSTQGSRNLRHFPLSVTTEEAEELLRDSIPYDNESSFSSASASSVHKPPPLQRAVSAYDIILENDIQFSSSDTSYQPMKIGLDKEHHIVDRNSIDWDAFIAEQYAKDEMKHHHHGRELLNYDHVEWHNYFPMLGCRTEYYFRYSGTQTIPPCHGRFERGQSRTNTNHWRVMKDPIRISKRQLLELHRLLRERIAPIDDPLNPCQPDTAAKVDPDTGLVNVARPLQQPSIAHYSVFCECRNWESKWREDQQWCLTEDQVTRFYDQPYNFPSTEF